MRYSVAPAACAAATTSSSRTDPPGWTTARTPASSSTCRPSGKGKKASEAATDPAARSDVAAFCRMRGHELVEITDEPEHTAYLVRT